MHLIHVVFVPCQCFDNRRPNEWVCDTEYDDGVGPVSHVWVSLLSLVSLTSLSWSLASCPCWVPPPPFLPPLLTGAGVGPPFCRRMPPFSTAGLSWLSCVSLNSLMARSLVLSHVLKMFSNHSFITSLSDLFILSTNTFEVATWKEDCFIDFDWQNSLLNSNLELYFDMFRVSGNWNQQK